MTWLIIRRVVWSIPLLLAVTALTFVLVSFAPGNPAETILGNNATPQAIVSLQKQLGLNLPIYAQYWHWLERTVHGNLGVSLISGEPVATLLNSRLPASLSLIIAGTVIAAVAGIFLGVLAATKGGVVGRAVEAASVLGLAVPNFWLALVLIELFAVAWSLLPATGFVPISVSVTGWLQALILPVAAISGAATTIIAVSTRDAVLDALRRDFVRVLAANGISRRSIIWRHALRNAAIPATTVIGVNFVGLLGGSVLVEAVFAIPGLGSELTSAASQHDIPVIQGVVVYFTIIVIIVNLLVDLTCGVLDPRVRQA